MLQLRHIVFPVCSLRKGKWMLNGLYNCIANLLLRKCIDNKPILPITYYFAGTTVFRLTTGKCTDKASAITIPKPSSMLGITNRSCCRINSYTLLFST